MKRIYSWFASFLLRLCMGLVMLPVLCIGALVLCVIIIAWIFVGGYEILN